jgi:hypothetical protein
MKSKRAWSVLLVVGLALAALGQVYFAYRREYVWDGVFFWAAAIIAIGLVVRWTRRSERGLASDGRSTWQRWASALREHPLRVMMAGGGLCLSFLSGWSARRRPLDAGFADLLALWMVGVMSFLLAFLPSLARVSDLWRRLIQEGEGRRWIRRNRWTLVGLGVLMAFAWLVRGYDLEHIPANLGGDEGTWAMEGLAMLDGRLANPFATRWFAFPSLSFLLWGLSMRLFGETVAGVRAASALIGAGSVLTTFLLAQEIWNRRTGWLAGGVLAVAHYHLHFSRLAVNNIADSFLVTGGLYLLVRGLRSRRFLPFALAGAMMGAGWYGYFGARLVGIIAALYLIWRMVIEHRFLARYGDRLLVLVAAGLVVAAPLFIHYAAHPGVLTEGLDRVSIFSSGWLAREQEITGRSALGLLLEQFWKSISAFHYTLDPTFWYRPEVPLLDLVSGILFVVGLVWCTMHWRWPSNVLMLIWFWGALLTGWVITENPPSSQRLVIVTPALALLVAVGLERLVGLGRELLGARREWAWGIGGAVLLVTAALNLGHYFLVYTPSRVYGNPTAEMTTHLARQLASEGDNRVVYFHGPPFVYWNFGTLRFMARGVKGIDVPPPGEGGAVELDLRRGALFVFHPARTDELEQVRTRHPGGETAYVHSSADGKLLYAVYEIDR